MENKKDIKTELDCPLKKHTPKSWLIALLLGIFIGLAVIVPGISGSTIAIIFGLYASMLYAMGNVLSDFKRCIKFLIPIGIGVVIGFVAGFLVIQSVFEAFLFQLICLFAGLMIGAVPAITKEIKGSKPTAGRAVLFAIGFIIPIAICVVSILMPTESEIAGEALKFSVSGALLYFPLGFVVSITQIVPGLSATAILMAFGQFRPIMNSLHREYLFDNPSVIIMFASLALGFLVGLVGISKAFSVILSKHKLTAFYMITGLAFGSIASMFLNSDVYELYTEWAKTAVPVADVIVGIVLLIVGFAASFALTKYELSRDK